MKRSEIKKTAKQALKNMHWSAVGSTMIYEIFLSVILMCFSIFLGPIFAGYHLYCTKVYRGEKVSMKFDCTGRKVGGYVWMSLFAFLWILPIFVPFVLMVFFPAYALAFVILLIPAMIPIIIKSFSYSLTTYILGDCPEVKATDALTLSKRMMKGYKWKLFVMQLSFIGWDILSVITLGLVGLFYSDPYKGISFGGFYDEVKKAAIAGGVVTEAQLNGTTAA